MSLLSAIRTVVHRKIVLPGVNFLYGRVCGMDLGKNVRISTGAKLDKTHPEGIHIGDYTAITSGAAILTHDFVNRAHRDVHIGRNRFIGCGAITLGTDGVLATMHRSDIEKVLAVNLTAPLILTKYASRGMLSAREGRIVNISSIIASTGFNGLAAYAASKAGLEGMTRSLSRELGKRNITVNCVAPGYMETEMTRGLDVHKMASIRRRATLGLAAPEDAAGAVAYLIGPEAGKITGTIVTVDGGSTA